MERASQPRTCIHAILAALLAILPAVIGAVPIGFADEVIHESPQFITSMDALPSGELILGYRDGTMQIVDPASGPSEAVFFKLHTSQTHEGGLVGLAVDPRFEQSRRIYFFYIEDAGGQDHITVGHLTAEPGLPWRADPASYTEILSIPDALDTEIHYGGGLAVGQDGNLFIGIGDDGLWQNAQNPDNLRGKILRLTPDGTVPGDNPTVFGRQSAIYAYGVRNPFRLINDSVRNRVFVHDVGQDRFEEINLLLPGANYGWPDIEGRLEDNPGAVPPPNFVDPVFAYPHSDDEISGRAITDGLIYQGASFPSEWRGRYFFSDWTYETGKIFTGLLSDDGRTMEDVALFDWVGGAVTDIVEVDGNIYYTANSTSQSPDGKPGSLRRISYVANEPPMLSIAATPTTGTVPLSVSFTAIADDEAPDSLTFHWFFGDGTTASTFNAAHEFGLPGVYNVVGLAVDQYGATARREIQIEALQDYTINLDGSVFDISSGASEPVEGVLLLLRHPDNQLIASEPISNGRVLVDRLHVAIAGTALVAEFHAEGLVPRRELFFLAPVGNTFTGEFQLSSNAITGRVADQVGASLAGVEVAARRWNRPLTNRGTAQGALHSGGDGGFYIPLFDSDAGYPVEVVVNPNLELGRPSIAKSFIAPLDRAIEWEAELGMFGGGQLCYTQSSDSDQRVASDALEEILHNRCSVCHGIAGGYEGLNLSRGFAISQLTTKSSNQAPGVPLVSFGSPQSSYLWEKIGCATPQKGSFMPANGVLTTSERQLIYDWIRNGTEGPRELEVTLYHTPLNGPSPLFARFQVGINGGIPPYNVEWDFGDRQARSGLSSSHTWTEFETGVQSLYFVRARVTDSSIPPQVEELSMTAIVAGVESPLGNPPVAAIKIENDLPRAGVPVVFSAAASSTKNGHILLYEWDFGGDGVFEFASPSPTAEWTFHAVGEQSVRLRIVDSANNQSLSELLTFEVRPNEYSSTSIIAY